METKRPPILVIDESQAGEFEQKCKQLIEADYRMVSSDCGFVDSSEYDFCSSYHAIFQDKLLDPELQDEG